MAITENINNIAGVLPLGNRNDICYLCAKKLTAKNDMEYKDKMAKIKGKLEGQSVVKIGKPGTEFVLCLECIHELAKNNPLPAEKEGE